MTIRGSAAMALLSTAVSACAAAAPDAPPPAAVAPSSTGEPTATATASVAPPPETPAERRARIGKAKREHCQAMAHAVQSRGQTVLLNVHNGATLIGVAGELDESADVMDRVAIDTEELDELRRLRGTYTSTSRAMARALFACADAAGFEERKTPLAEFRELEPKLRDVLAQLSEECSAPVK